MTSSLIYFRMDCLFRKVDGCLLGLTRMGFGFLMFVDCFVERGLHVADHKWNDDGCQFPLVNQLKPLSSEWMTILQFIQGLGALAICLGYKAIGLRFFILETYNCSYF